MHSTLYNTLYTSYLMYLHTFILLENGFMNRGFTLAEVLITIGIIGIVAALTFPILLKHHRKTVIETSLKRFYTVTNQAVLLSTADNGEIQYWEFVTAETPENIQTFYNKYFDKYLKTNNTGIYNFKDGTRCFAIYFTDGSGATITYKGHDWFYCINARYLDEWNKYHGSQCFKFGFYPTWGSGQSGQSHLKSTYQNKGIEPYVNASKVNEDGSVSPTTPGDLYSQKWYAKAIQLNNWTIPDDYPVRY